MRGAYQEEGLLQDVLTQSDGMGDGLQYALFFSLLGKKSWTCFSLSFMHSLAWGSIGRALLLRSTALKKKYSQGRMYKHGHCYGGMILQRSVSVPCCIIATM